MSSFTNLVGTPRDAYSISKTNYLQTDADLEPAMEKKGEDAIKDRKLLADQMVEIEQLKAKAGDKRLAAISSIIGDVDNIMKVRKAVETRKRDQADDRILAQKSRSKILQAALNGKDVEDFKFQQFILNADDPTMESVDAGRHFVDANAIDEDLDQTLTRYENNIAVLNDVGMQLGTGEARSYAEFEEKAKQVKTSMYDTLYLNLLISGVDIDNARVENQIFDRLHDKVEKTIGTMRTKFGYNYETKFNEEQTKILDKKLIKTVEGANKTFTNTETNQEEILDDSFWGENGFVEQVAAAKNIALPEAADYAVERIAALVDDGLIEPYEARAIYETIPFYAKGGKKFKNYTEWVETLKEGSEPRRRAQARIDNLGAKIAELENAKNTERKAINKADVNRFYENRALPLIEDNKENGIIGLEISQAGALLSELINSDMFVVGETEQTEGYKKLLKAASMAETGGTADKNVYQNQQYATDVNDYELIIKKLVRRTQSQDGDVDKLTDEGDLKARRMFSAFKSEFYGVDNKNIDNFEVMLAAEEITLDGYMSGIKDKLEANHTDYDAPTGATRLSETNLQAYQKLQTELSKNGSLFATPSPMKGEPVDRLLDFVTNPSANQSLLQYYEGLKPRIVTDEGIKLLTGTQAVYYRARLLGIQDPNTLLPNPESEWLDLPDQNDLNDKPNDTKTYIHMNYDEQRNMKNFLDVLAKKNGDDDKYTGTRGGQKFGRDGLTGLTARQVLDIAERGGTDFGRYGFKREAIIELLGGEKPMVNLNTRFTEDLQSYLVLARMRQKANRPNAIRGAITEDTKDYRRLTNLSAEEITAVNEVFPNLLKVPMNQFQNLQADVAKTIISDIEKAQAITAGKKQKAMIAEQVRQKKTKKELRSGELKVKPEVKPPETMEELLEVPSVKLSRSKRTF